MRNEMHSREMDSLSAFLGPLQMTPEFPKQGPETPPMRHTSPWRTAAEWPRVFLARLDE